MVGITAGGQVISGIAEYRLASVPSKPNKPINIPSLTDETRVGVRFGDDLPDSGGSEINNIELWIDDTQGNF